MGINRKYSLGGNSEDIDEKYKEYSQGLLVEMLNMPPELEAKVEPDMTVKQVREIKRQARQKSVKMRPDVRGLMDDTYCAVCGNPLSKTVRLEKCPECGQMQDWGWLDKVSGEVQQEEPGEEGGRSSRVNTRRSIRRKQKSLWRQELRRRNQKNLHMGLITESIRKKAR